MQGQRIGVIGGSGFIGGWLVDVLLRQHHVVRVIDQERCERHPELWVAADVRNVEDLLRPSADTAVERLLPPGRRKYRATVIANAGLDQPEVIERTVAPGETNEVVRPLGVDYPADIFSMSHIALPFPPSDGLYGSHPSREDDTFGVSLGTIAPRGETGALIVGLDSLLRVSSNPFYAYVAQRIEEGLPAE